MSSSSAWVPRAPLGRTNTTISRLIVGGWQLSAGHRPGMIDEEVLFADLDRMVESGMSTFDCADIYTGVEELFGRYLARHADRDQVQVHTKLVPDRPALAGVDEAYVRRIVERSLRRLGAERLDLVQLSWWDYEVPGYVGMAQALAGLQQEGKIRHLAATNLDVPRLREILDAGVPLVANQVQYSLLDRRPEHGMADLCRERGLSLLCYGTLAGGFLSGRYLGAAPPEEPLANRSLTKYRLIIDEFGGWALYQELLAVLQEVARRHQVALSSVAVRYVLDRPQVAAAILGTYHGGHLDRNREILDLTLDQADRDALDGVLARGTGPKGDVFGLERVPDGPHARIMRYNLNAS